MAEPSDRKIPSINTSLSLEQKKKRWQWVITCHILPLNRTDIWLISSFSTHESCLCQFSYLSFLMALLFICFRRDGGHHVRVLQRHDDRVLHHPGGLVRRSIRRGVLSYVCHKTSLAQVSGKKTPPIYLCFFFSSSSLPNAAWNETYFKPFYLLVSFNWLNFSSALFFWIPQFDGKVKGRSIFFSAFSSFLIAKYSNNLTGVHPVQFVFFLLSLAVFASSV